MLWMVLVGCNGLRTFTVEQSARTTIEQGTLVENLLGDIGFEDFVTMDLTASQEMRNQGAAPGDVRDVRLVLFELEAIDPEDGDLSFLESMDLLVSAPDLEEVRVAWATEFPEGETRVVFELEDLDLSPYVVSQSTTLSTDVRAHRPDADTLVEARFAVDITVTAQGVKNNL